MWKKGNIWAIGGLMDIGFKPATDFLIVLSSQGRGLFDCVKDEKIARDNNPNYYEICIGDTGKVKGIGILEGEEIQCGGFEYADNIKKETDDGWKIQITKEKRSNWRKKELVADVMYFVHEESKEKIEVELFFYGIDRGYGFSDTGKSFVIGTSSEVIIWNRKTE